MRQERFTEQAQEARVASQELVRRQRHSQWDVEHILLALLEQGDGLAVRVLEELRIDVEGVKQQGGRQARSVVDQALKQTFRPEFLNRIDEIIIFHSLSEEHIKEIVDLLIKELEKRLVERQISLELTEEARLWLVKEGYDPTYGARPLRRAIQRYVENPLSRRVLLREFEEGDKVVVDVEEDKGLVFIKGDSRAKAEVS